MKIYYDDPATRAYLKDLNNHYKPISREEQKELIPTTQAGDKIASQRLLESLLIIPVKAAKAIIIGQQNYGLSFLELVTEGNFGLYKAILKIGGFNSSSKLETWVYSIVRNKMLDRVREQVKNKRHNLINLDEIAGDDSKASKNSVEHLELASDIEKLNKELEKLEGEERKILRLKFYEGKSYTEIRELTCRASGTIAKRIRSGLEKLRFAMGA